MHRTYVVRFLEAWDYCVCNHLIFCSDLWKVHYRNESAFTILKKHSYTNTQMHEYAWSLSCETEFIFEKNVLRKASRKREQNINDAIIISSNTRARIASDFACATKWVDADLLLRSLNNIYLVSIASENCMNGTHRICLIVCVSSLGTWWKRPSYTHTHIPFAHLYSSRRWIRRCIKCIRAGIFLRKAVQSVHLHTLDVLEPKSERYTVQITCIAQNEHEALYVSLWDLWKS